MHIRTLTSLLAVLFYGISNAQFIAGKQHLKNTSPTRICGTMQYLQMQQQQDTGLEQRMLQIEQHTQQIIQKQLAGAKAPPQIIIIPIVFHVVYNNATENISSAQVLSQLTVLNDDFRRQNADTSNTPSAFKSLAADVEIQFCLASVDPSGNATTGITRTATSHGPFTTDDDIKFNSTGGKTAWPRDSYLNFWIGNLSGGLLGYAQFPGGTASTDGVVCTYTSIGKPPANPFAGPFNRGRTASHEVGHWLNLRHIWADDGTSCTGSDLVGDTPNQGPENYGCPSFPHTDACTPSSPGVMYMNYMDYTDDNCMNIFTLGQKTRMRALFNTGGAREPLLTSAGCGTLTTNDAGISQIISPPSGSFCNDSIFPLVTLQNFGSNTLTTVTINYQLDGGTVGTYNWTGNLTTGQTANITLPAMPVTAGTHTYTAYTTLPNGTTDGNSTNNAATQTFTITSPPAGVPLPFQQGFETNPFPPSGWTLQNGGNTGYSWARTTVASGYGTSTASTRMDNYSSSTTIAGDKDALVSPAINFSSASTPLWVKWDRAYARYDNATSDSMNVYYSVDCEATWVRIFSRGGSGLATAANTTAAFVPNSSQWATDSVNINVLLGQTSVKFKFESVSDWGNYLYLDNINLYGTISVPPPVANFSGTPVSVCSGSTVSFTDLSTNTPTSWLWSFIGGTPSSSTSQNPVVTYNTPGAYTVSLIAANAGGSDTVVKTNYITVNANSATTITGTNVSCNGGSNGSADLTLTSGASPFSYNWSTGATTQDITGLSAGTYTVTVTDARNCTTTSSVTISQPQALNATTSSVNATCPGTCNGSATVSASGGTSPYTYLWSANAANQTTAVATGLCGGAYNATVTDAKNCTKAVSVTVNSNPGPNSSFTASANQCVAGNSFNFSNTGDLPNSCGMNCPVFSWNYGDGNTSSGTTTAAANPSHSYTAAGTYTVIQTITNGSGCSTSATQTVIVFAPPSASIAGTNPSCNGGSNGAANLTPSGGTSPYTYLWSTGAITQDLTGLSSGTYSVTITDANSCSTSASVTLANPPAMTLTTGSTNASCGGSDGIATVSASGGVAPYSYLWSSGSSASSATGLSAGTYSVTVTDANTCTATATVTINSTGGPSATITGTNVSCNGGNNGVADLTVSGGTTPYTYNWNTGATTQDLSGIPNGTYSVTVTDANNCKATASITITQPQVLTASIAGTNVSCNGGNNGSANLTVSGGTPVYNFLWSNGATTEDVSGLPAGTYSVTVTDSKFCQKTASVTISQPQLLTANIAGTNVLCNGGTNGTADLTPSGGTTPYNYVWNNGASTQDLTGIPAGNYSVTVTDSKACTATSTVAIGQPPVLAVSASATGVSCNGGNNGTATANPSGGISPFSFSWSNGATTQSITNLSSGNYSVTVTDANGCTKTATANVSQSGGITTSIIGTNISCNGGNNGAVNLTVSGGTIPYNYNWSNGATTQDLSGLVNGTYMVTITDGNGCTATTGITITEPPALTASIVASNISCNGNNDGAANLTPSGGTSPYTYNWNNGAATQDLTGLAAGNYSVTVADANGCQTISNTIISEPSALSDTAVITNVNCNGGNNGAINLTPSGGTSPYTYVWSNGAVTQDLTGLTAGVYTVTVSDNNSCSITSTFPVNQPAAISITTTFVSVSCNGGNNGSATATPSNGNTPYSYTWSTTPVQNTSTATGLTAGTYTVTVTDNNGCSKTASGAVNQPFALIANIAGTNVRCNGANNGAADLTVSGGTTSYSYNWNNGAVTQDISGLAAGSYSVTVTDAKGCTKISAVTISEPAALSASIAGANVTCNGNCNGAADLTPSGGTSPYTYNWSNGNTTQDLISLCAGTYNVTVADTMGCSATSGVTISQPAAMALSTGSTNASCGGADGTASVVATGGVSPYSYLWSNGATASNITGLSAGTYSVTITGSNGCSKTASVTINEVGGPAGSVTGTNVSCNGDSNGAADLTVSGGSTPYTYSWSNGANTQDIAGLNAGTFTVTITDFNGCQAFQSISITQPNILSTGISGTNANCNGTCDGSANLSVTGGTTVYSYAWSNGATTQDISGICAGTYKVTVTDSKNCQAVDSVTINKAVGLFLTIAGNNVTCNGNNNGSANLTVSGGTIPYTYIWSNGATSEDLTGLTIGAYHITVSDAGGCQNSDSITISEPAALSASIAGTDVSCGSVNNGSVNLSVSGGVMPYAYSWSNGATVQDISGLSTGTYYITVNDSNLCLVTDSVIINQSASISINITGTNISCTGGNNGAANLTVTSGTSPFTYSWSNGATTEDINGLSAGTYSVTVTDSNLCSVTGSVTIAFASGVTANIINTITTCNGTCDGVADLQVTGGITPYTYSWSNGATTQDLSGVCAGSYSVTVSDAGSCSAVGSTNVNQPQAFSTSFTITPSSCYGSDDGAVNMTVSGGTPAYSYNWSNGATTEDIAGLNAGGYYVTITDDNGCQMQDTVTVTEPTAISFSLTSTNGTCNGNCDGTAGLIIPLKVALICGDMACNDLLRDVPLLNYMQDSLGYVITPFDDNSSGWNTSFFDLVVISESVNSGNTAWLKNNKIGILTLEGSNFDEFELGTNGSTGGGGSTNVFIVNNTHFITQPFPTGTLTVTTINTNLGDMRGWANDVTNLAYYVTDNNRSKLLYVDKGGILEGGTNLAAGRRAFYGARYFNNLNTNGRILFTRASLWTASVSYNWSNSNGIVATSQNQSNLCSGTYFVTLTDSAGCAVTDSVVIGNTSVLNAAISGANISCNGSDDGIADLTVTGGSTPYSYLWSNAAITQDLSGLSPGTYIVTVTDANICTGTASVVITEPASLTSNTTITGVSCNGGNNGTITVNPTGGTTPYSYNWSSGDTSQTVSGLSAGTYSVTLTDANGCTATASATISEPAALTAAATSSDATCGASDGSATVSPAGGASPYNYVWNNGGSSSAITNLSAGTYTVTVTDSNSCTTTASTTVNNPIPSIAAVSSDVSCNGGANGVINITISGGDTPYTYLWSNGATTEDLTGIPAGNYSVTATDDNGCQTAKDMLIGEPPALVSSVAGTNETCAGNCDGSVNLSVSGGTTAYTYNWSNGATTQDLTALCSGSFYVTVSDGNSCQKTDSVIIGSGMNLSASSINNSCNGICDGAISLTVAGGTPGYSYNWSNGAIAQNLNGLCAGNYSVTVTDAASCQKNLSVTINEPDSISATITNTDIACNGTCNGSSNLSVNGGTSPYTFFWSNSATSEDISALCAGNYSVTITDSSGCQHISATAISQPSQLAIMLTNTNVTCNGGSNGSINLTPSGGTTPYTYNWSDGAVTEDLSGLTAGTYSVTVTDGGLCTKTAQITVNQPPFPLSASVSGTDISCNGLNNGSVNLTPSGGTTPYSYLWSNGSAAQDLTGLSAGIYAITLSDANGCQTTSADTISEPSQLSATSIVTNLTCYGGNNGAIDLTASGGISPYSFLWSNGAVSEDLNGISSGTYTVTVTDSNDCTFNLTASISQPANFTTAITAVNVSCNGGNNGSLDLTVSGGTSPYLYGWSNGATTQGLNGLSAGSYSVTITDTNGCTKTITSTITEPSALAATTVVADVSCNGNNDGDIDLTVTGGSPLYTYNWSNNAVTQDINGLTPGTYSVTITDGLGCVFNLTDTVNTFQALSVIMSDTDITCFGANNGSVSITLSGGNSPYAYNWSNGEITQNITGLAPGAYYATITDNNGCQTIANAIITEPALINDTMIITPVTCSGGSDGAINITVSGGISPYSFNWSNGAITQNISGLTQGTYAVTITDAKICSVTSSATINQPAGIATSTASINVNCYGESTGTVTLIVSGGTSPYSFLWSNSSTSQNLTGLSAGSYNLTVTDASGCSKTTSAVISQPAALNTSIAGTNTSCTGTNDGSANLTVSGGTPAYSYNWSNGATTQDINSLSPGTYSVTITDGNSCKKYDSVTITQPASLAVTVTSTDVSCYGGNNGTAGLSVSGGISPYSYSWSNGADSATLSGLQTGTYSVTVSDFNNCQQSSSAIITGPSAIIISSSVTNASCGMANGTASVAASGGVNPYTYQWGSGGTAATDTGLVAGSYSVTVTDSNGCADTANANISNVGGPVVTSVNTDASCQNTSDGAIDITVSGGTTPYSFIWSNGATSEDVTGLAGGIYTVTVTETGGCKTILSDTLNTPPLINSGIAVTNAGCVGLCDGAADLIVSGGNPGYTYIWSTGATTQDISGLCAGTYTVTITDATNCQIAAMATIVDTTDINISFAIVNPGCTGNCDGNINSSVSGGQPSYTYQWSNGGITSNLNGLCAGAYFITVTDANGCQGTGSVNITAPLALTAGIIPANTTCNGTCNGALDLTPAGGTPPYSFVWSNNFSTEDISGLCPGTYSVSITDNNGCQQTMSSAVSEPSAIFISFITTDVSCKGGNNGAIDLTVSGGVPGYSYSWSNGATTEDVTTISAGAYPVTITDSKGCIMVSSAVVNEPSAINLSISTVKASCDSTDGSASVSVGGGTSPYTYNWSSGGTSATENGLAAGNYTISVTDANGCNRTEPVLISNFIPAIVVLYSDITCNGSNNGWAMVAASGGATPYTYLWSSGGTDSTETGLMAGNYTVSVSDSSGCLAIQPFTVSEPAALSSNISSTGISCFGNTDGTATVVVSGGTSPYNYNWSSGGNISTVTALSEGTYYITITDSNSCSVIDSVIITTPAAIALTTASIPANCSGGNGSASISVSGGTIPYTYLWSNGQTGTSATALSAGTYIVTVTDANNCTTAGNIPVGNIEGLSVSITGINTLCAGSCNGSAAASITGGTLPFSYLWDDLSNQTSQTASGLCPGIYNVMVSDSTGCSVTSSITITEPPAFALTTTASDPTGGICNGIAVVIASGGVSPYSYQWNDTNSQTTNIATGLCEGTYCVAVSDSSGCSDTACVTMAGTGTVCNLSLTLFSINESCPEASDGAIDVSLSGGTLPYKYFWSNNATTEDLNQIAAGNYSITATDANGCSITDTIAILMNYAICLNIPTAFTPNGDGKNDKWVIRGLNANSKVEIYNRWGTLLFASKGYSEAWDGSFEGKNVPTATYYYIVTMDNGDSYTGFVRIVY